MKNLVKKQPGYRIMMILTVLSTLAAIMTLIPVSTASKLSMAGYRAFCSYRNGIALYSQLLFDIRGLGRFWLSSSTGCFGR